MTVREALSWIKILNLVSSYIIIYVFIILFSLVCYFNFVFILPIISNLVYFSLFFISLKKLLMVDIFSLLGVIKMVLQRRSPIVVIAEILLVPFRIE